MKSISLQAISVRLYCAITLICCLFPHATKAQFNNYRAFMEVGNSCNIDNDTYDGYSFNLTNYSTNPSFNIVQLKVNLSTAIMKDIFFDPFGSAGDQVYKGFTADAGGPTVGFTAASYGFFDGPTGGFRELTVNFASSGSNTFGQFNTLSFSIDIDHSSLKNYSGPDNAGRISGLDLVGSTISIEFSDGTILSAQLTPIRDCDGKSEVILSDLCTGTGLPTLVAISVPFSPTYTYDTQHQIRMLGLPNKDLILYQVEGALDLKSERHIPAPFDIDEHEENAFINLKVDTFSLGSFGLLDIPVTIDNTAANGGRTHFFAITVGDSSGISQAGQYRFCKSPVSNVPVLHYYEGVCVNCLGPEKVASNGDIFQVDQYEAGGGYPNEDYTLYQGIANTTDDDIFKTQLSGQLNYDVPVPNNDYEVSCLFSENEYGVPFATPAKAAGGTGSRKFNVVLEGNVVDNSLDIFSAAGGHSTALYRRYVVTVSDQNLDLNLQDLFITGVDGPCLSGFCVKPLVLSVFPVEFTGFTATQAGTEVLLNWETANEINNDRFLVERSLDGHRFVVLGTVAGKGNSDVPQQYTSFDPQPQAGLNYYRIRQIDVDGSVSYTHTLSVLVEKFSFVSVFPNPSEDGYIQLHMEGYAPNKAVKLQLLNMMGQQVLLENTRVDGNGSNEKIMDLTRFPAGMYTLVVHAADGKRDSKMVLLK